MFFFVGLYVDYGFIRQLIERNTNQFVFPQILLPSTLILILNHALGLKTF